MMIKALVRFTLVVFLVLQCSLCIFSSSVCYVSLSANSTNNDCGLNTTIPCYSINQCLNYDSITSIQIYPGVYGGDNNCLQRFQQDIRIEKATIQGDVIINCEGYDSHFLAFYSLYVSSIIFSNSRDVCVESDGDSDSVFSTFVNCTFQGCGGGAIDPGETFLNVTDCLFWNNINEGSHSQLLTLSTSGVISRSKFINNRSQSSVIGVFLERTATISIVGVTFLENSAASDSGGAILIYSESDSFQTYFHIENCNFQNNWAQLNGGAIAIYSPPGVLNISSSNFWYNEANQDGGAIFVSKIKSTSFLHVTNVTIFNNTALDGAALFLNTTIDNDSNKTLQQNQITFKGVLIYNNQGNGLSFYNTPDLAQNFTLSGLTLVNNNPTNLECMDPTLNYCIQNCAINDCDDCSGTCDIKDLTVTCHDFTSRVCFNGGACEYSIQEYNNALVGKCKCVGDYEGLSCDTHTQSQTENSKLCFKGNCWVWGLIVGILVIFGIILFLGIRCYLLRKNYMPINSER